MPRYSQPPSIVAETSNDPERSFDDLPAGSRIPDAHQPIPTMRGQQFASRMKRKHRDLLDMPRKNRDSPLAFHIPNLNAWIGTGDGQMTSVRVPGDDLLSTWAGR